MWQKISSVPYCFGIFSSQPGKIRAGLRISSRFREIISATEQPHFLAIAQRVSPFLTM